MKLVHMTAVGGPEVLKVVDAPDPEPEAGEVRVRNEAIAVNFHEINERRGQEPPEQLPVPMGSDFAGTIDKVGEGVTHLNVGDRVVGIATRGAYAEKTCTMSLLVFPIPDDVTVEQAAACPVAGLTAYFLLKNLGVGPETTIVTHAAAGSMGCFMGGLAKETGCTSIGLVSTQEKAAVAAQAGYMHQVVYTEKDPVRAVLDITGADGADVVYDSVAGPNFKRSFAMCAVDGTVVLFGHAAGDPPTEQLLGWMGEQQNFGLRTYFLGTTIANRMMELGPAFQHLFEGFQSGALQVPLTIMPLDEVREAHRRIEAQETVGKVILKP